MRSLAVLGALIGLGAGIADGMATCVENPRSFLAGTVPAFLGAAGLLHAIPGALAGWVWGLFGRAARARGHRFAAAGVALFVFSWCGVRVHVRWFFGEPLVSAPNLLANTGLLAACALLAVALDAPARHVARAAAGRAGLPAAVGGILLAALLALAGPGRARTGGPNGPAPPGARDVLLVTLDTTRADHLSAYGYPRGTTPAIDRLARRGGCDVVWSAIPLTNPSHCTLFTGLPPRVHGVRNNGTALPDSIPTFVTGLARAGWSCGAFVSGIPLKAGLSGLAAPFAAYDDAFSSLERVHPMLTSLAIVRVADRLLPGDLLERRADETVDAAVAWLSRAPAPRLVWVHLFDPHTPYRARPPWPARFARESAGWTAAGHAVTGWPIADYDAEIGGTDRALLRLVRAFEERSPDGVVVVAADHGEGLLQHGDLTHGALLHEEDLRIAWVVSAPGAVAEGAAGRLVLARPPRPATDVPSILEALARGRPAPASNAAAAVAETFPPEGRGRRTAAVGLLPDGRIAKTIVDWERGERAGFDLGADPGETRALDPSGPEWAGLLATDPDRGAAGPLDPDVERRLRALGYVH